MLGLMFWKHASGEETEETHEGQLNTCCQREQWLKMLVLSGAAIVIVAVALGLPIVGLSVYLFASVPFILFGS
ncbi:MULTISPECIES: hypothetical protein [Paraburkholderia]|uniref:hypothetical protein n=1 Tax=Paraburkholderia TaxID=1822464 RepID=UPI00084211F4|nr:hypothetical protein [Paraburkholderia nodosa]